MNLNLSESDSMETPANSNPAPTQNSVDISSLGSRARKSPIVFAVQTIIVFIVILAAIVNLSINSHDDPNSKLWIMLLSGCVGYYLPNPSIKIVPKVE